MSFARVDPANPSHPPVGSGLPPIPEKVVVVDEYKFTVDDPTSHYQTVAKGAGGRYEDGILNTASSLWDLLTNQVHSFNDTWARFSNTSLWRNTYDRFDTQLHRLKMPPVLLTPLSQILPTGLYRVAHNATGADIMMTATIVVAMLLQLRDKRQWHQMDMFVKLLLGVMCFAVPHLSLHVQITKPHVDAIEVHVTRMVGALMLGFAVLDYRLRHVVLRDTRVAYDIAVGRFMGMLLALLAVIYVHTAPDTVWNHRHALWSGSLLAVHVIGDLWQVITSQHAGQIATRRTYLNVHIGIDHVLTFLFGIMWFAFPIWTLQLSNVRSNYVAVASHVGHFVGAMYIYSSLLGMRSTYWPSADVKRDLILSRLTTEGLIILSNILLLFSTDNWGRHMVGHLPWQIGGHSLLALNLLLGYFAEDIPIYDQFLSALNNRRLPREPLKTTTGRTHYTRSGATSPVTTVRRTTVYPSTTTVEPSITETATTQSTRTTTTSTSSEARERNVPVESWLSTSRSPSPTRRRLVTTRRTVGARTSTLDK